MQVWLWTVFMLRWCRATLSDKHTPTTSSWTVMSTLSRIAVRMTRPTRQSATIRPQPVLLLTVCGMLPILLLRQPTHLSTISAIAASTKRTMTITPLSSNTSERRKWFALCSITSCCAIGVMFHLPWSRQEWQTNSALKSPHATSWLKQSCKTWLMPHLTWSRPHSCPKVLSVFLKKHAGLWLPVSAFRLQATLCVTITTTLPATVLWVSLQHKTRLGS